MDETIVYFMNNGGYNLVIDSNTIKGSIIKHRQYYSFEQNDLDIKQNNCIYHLFMDLELKNS